MSHDRGATLRQRMFAEKVVLDYAVRSTRKTILADFSGSVTWKHCSLEIIDGHRYVADISMENQPEIANWPQLVHYVAGYKRIPGKNRKAAVITITNEILKILYNQNQA